MCRWSVFGLLWGDFKLPLAAFDSFWASVGRGALGFLWDILNRLGVCVAFC